MGIVFGDGSLGGKLIQLDPTQGFLALRGGRTLGVDGSMSSEPKTVLVQGERVVSVAGARESAIPDGARVVDVTGMFVLPGLIDAHLHLAGNSTFDPYRMFLQPQPAIRVIRACLDAASVLAAGFTTVRDLGHGVMDHATGIRRAINDRLVAGPRVLTSGWAISQSGGHGDPRIFPREWTRALRPRSTFADGPDECRRVVRENFGAGADLIKIYATDGGLAPGPGGLRAVPNYTQIEIEAMVDEAHRRGARVAAHATGRDGLKNAILGGVNTIEHGGDIGAHDDLLDLMVEKDVILVPTLSVYFWMVERGKDYGADPRMVAGSIAMMELQAKYLKKIHRHGVKIAVGTDMAYPFEVGENARELEMLVEYGLSAQAALLAGTRTGADALGIVDQVGSLEPNMLADIVVLTANPLEDIGCIRRKENIKLIAKTASSLSRAVQAPS